MPRLKDPNDSAALRLVELFLTYNMETKKQELSLLLDKVGDARIQQRQAIKDYDDIFNLYESSFGASKKENFTTSEQEIVGKNGDLGKKYQQELRSIGENISNINNAVRDIRSELLALDKMQKNVQNISYAYGDDPTQYDLGDLATPVLAEQFNVSPKFVDKVKATNPMLFTPKLFTSLELLR